MTYYKDMSGHYYTRECLKKYYAKAIWDEKIDASKVSFSDYEEMIEDNPSVIDCDVCEVPEEELQTFTFKYRITNYGYRDVEAPCFEVAAEVARDECGNTEIDMEFESDSVTPACAVCGNDVDGENGLVKHRNRWVCAECAERLSKIVR